MLLLCRDLARKEKANMRLRRRVSQLEKMIVKTCSSDKATSRYNMRKREKVPIKDTMFMYF
jgi:hypothetical protein